MFAESPETLPKSTRILRYINCHRAANQDENTTVQLDEEAMAEFAEQRLDKEGNVVGKYDRSEKRPEDPVRRHRFF